MRRSKLYKKQLEVLGDLQVRHSVEEAIKLLKALPGVKFDQTVEVAYKLGIDPRKSDQTVRGVCPMPRGTGKAVRVAVVCDGPRLRKPVKPVRMWSGMKISFSRSKTVFRISIP